MMVRSRYSSSATSRMLDQSSLEKFSNDSISRFPRRSSTGALLVCYGLHMCVCSTSCYFVVQDLVHLGIYKVYGVFKFCKFVIAPLLFLNRLLFGFSKQNYLYRIQKQFVVQTCTCSAFKNTARSEPPPPPSREALFTLIRKNRQATRAEIDATIATFPQVELQQRQPSKKKRT